MAFLLGVVLILDILLWRVTSGLEWSIPLKWQTRIEAWKEGLTSRTQTLNYVWYLSQRNSELEKQFWHLKLVLPALRKKFSVPIWIEVSIHQSEDTGQKGIYISCLQRRFPELDIYESRVSCEVFPDVN